MKRNLEYQGSTWFGDLSTIRCEGVDCILICFDTVRNYFNKLNSFFLPTVPQFMYQMSLPPFITCGAIKYPSFFLGSRVSVFPRMLKSHIVIATYLQTDPTNE